METRAISIISGEDYINATIGLPKLAQRTKVHAKTLHQMFGPRGNPTANNLFEIVAYLQKQEGVRFQVRSTGSRLVRQMQSRRSPEPVTCDWFYAFLNCATHLSHHTGQIIYLCKQLGL